MLGVIPGGTNPKEQIRALEQGLFCAASILTYSLTLNCVRAGVEIVVGTPGRIEDMMSTNKLDLSMVCMLVLNCAVPLEYT